MFQIRNAKEETATIDILGKDIGESWWSEGYSMKNAKADLDGITAKKIIVNISSLGGDVNDALVIHDLFKMKDAEITARIMGMTASSATVLAMGADRIEMSENASFLIHNVWGVAMGDAEELRSVANDFELFDSTIKNIYKNKSNKSIEEISDLMAEEKWITPEEAKEFGLVDEVFTPTKAEAKYNVKVNSKFFTKPKDKTENKMDLSGITTQLKELKDTIVGFINSKKENATETVEIKILDEKEVQDKIKEFQTAFDTLKEDAEKVEAVTAEKDTLVTEKEEITKENTTLKSDKETLETDKQKLQDEVDRLKGTSTETNKGEEDTPEEDLTSDEGAFGRFVKDKVKNHLRL